MSLAIIAEALARIEHKVDALLSGKMQPMHFVGNSCPMCNQDVDYQVDVQSQVVVRRCGCKTGKIPATLPLLPVAPTGVKNGYPAASEEQLPSGAEDGPGSKAR